MVLSSVMLFLALLLVIRVVVDTLVSFDGSWKDTLLDFLGFGGDRGIVVLKLAKNTIDGLDFRRKKAWSSILNPVVL